MQTFAPEGTDIWLGFERLDRQRLGKQRVETWQILRALLGLSDGWRNHPATKMWENDIPALAFYGYTNCSVWIDRGYRDSLQPRFLAVMQGYPGDTEPPEWLDMLKISHRSNLIRKDPDHYKKFWPDVADDIPYEWRN